MATLKLWAACQQRGLANVRANGIVSRSKVRKIRRHSPYNPPAKCIIYNPQAIVPQVLGSLSMRRKLIITRGA